MQLGINEILDKANKARKKVDKVRILQENDNDVLRQVLQWTFHPKIKWLLPETDPDFKKCGLVDQQGIFYSNARTFSIFVEVDGVVGDPNLSQMRRELIFSQMLETLDPEDAKLLISMKNKRLPQKTITKSVVKAAFPGIIPEDG